MANKKSAFDKLDARTSFTAIPYMAFIPGDEFPALERLVQDAGGIGGHTFNEILGRTLEAMMVRIEAIEKWQEEHNRRMSES